MPSSDLLIEPAKPGDEVAIAELVQALADYEKAPSENKSTPESIRRQLFGERPVAECLLARMAGKPVAYAIFFASFSTWLCKPGLYLEDLFVLPQFRRQGVGAAILQRLALLAIERDYGRMEWACLDWNELAKSQYRKIGAKPLEEWRTWRLAGEALCRLAEPKNPAAADPVPPMPSPPEDAGKVIIHTDGGCKPNPGVGAWAAILRQGGHGKELVGGDPQTTNNRMELSAAINALEVLKKPCEIVLHTDSEYVKNGITKWIIGWKQNGWKRGPKKNERVLNEDLWRRLDAAITSHTVEWRWVRGHAGNADNERCDVLCSEEIVRQEARAKGVSRR